MSALSWSKAYQAELDLEEMAGGFPNYNEDGSRFTDADDAKCVKYV